MDLFDSIDKILPVIFFFVWIIFGMFFKRKKRQLPASGKNSPNSSKPLGGGLGELKKTLQKVFEEMQAPVVPPELESTLIEGTLEDSSVSENRPRVVPVPEKNKSVFETKQESAFALPVKKEKAAFSLAAVRQGIIWSEILAPPVSMRDEML